MRRFIFPTLFVVFFVFGTPSWKNPVEKADYPGTASYEMLTNNFADEFKNYTG